MNSDLEKSNALIQKLDIKLKDRFEQIDSIKQKQLEENELVRKNIKDRYDKEISIIKASLDSRVRDKVEELMGTEWPTNDVEEFFCNTIGKCKERKRLYKEWEPRISLQINEEIASKKQELKEELKNIIFERTDNEIIAEAERQKTLIKSYYEHIQTKIRQDINSELTSIAIIFAQSSATLGSITGAMMAVLLIGVMIKSSISDKLWFQPYKSFVVNSLFILVILCITCIGLRYFIAERANQKELITWIALPTAGTGALISFTLVSSGLAGQKFLANRNSITKKQQVINGRTSIKLPMRKSKP